MLWRWEEGRQRGDYDKFLLCQSKWLKFDFYLLRFRSGSIVKMHNDSAPVGYEHHRLNITIKRPRDGGVFLVYKPGSADYDLVTKRVVHFRPDIQRHAMSRVTGRAYMLSIGWLRKAR